MPLPSILGKLQSFLVKNRAAFAKGKNGLNCTNLVNLDPHLPDLAKLLYPEHTNEVSLKEIECVWLLSVQVGVWAVL